MFLFTMAMTLFGAIVSEINDIVASATRATKILEEKLESYALIKPRSISIFND